ncbi:hypothetical protein PX699_28220 [Sphingobium sp. H39-3-25]|uniref:hypothetical protein n=1 Tax=Sphingobium arseniciresistens TaxID=3030834 RepID=UPI0023B9EAA2|nr:hypothetical protein [Sphingobium arseniciresistens]
MVNIGRSNFHTQAGIGTFSPIDHNRQEAGSSQQAWRLAVSQRFTGLRAGPGAGQGRRDRDGKSPCPESWIEQSPNVLLSPIIPHPSAPSS